MIEIKQDEVKYKESINKINFIKKYDKEGEYFSLRAELRGIPGSTFVMTTRRKAELACFLQGCLDLLDEGVYDEF